VAAEAGSGAAAAAGSRGPDAGGGPAPAAVALNVVLLAALAATLLAWAHGPEGVTRFFWIAFAALGAAGLPLALVSRLRGAALTRRGLRLADLAALALVVALGLSELLLRAAARLWPTPLLAPTDARAGERLRAYKLRPGSLRLGQRVNAQGFVDEPFEVARRAGVRRIVALGDSFLVGVVDASRNFLTLLDERLDAGQPTEVLNFGVISTAPRDYLHLWRTEARRYEPDLVLLCFFAGNDVQGVRGASLLHADSLLVFAFLRRLFALSRELSDAAAAAAEGAAASARGGAGTEVPGHAPETFDAIERSRLEVCRREPGAHVRREWEQTLQVLDELAREIGPRLRVAILPDRFQVDDPLFRRIAGDEAEAFDRELPSRRLRDFFAQRGVPCLDLLPPLRAAEREGPTYAALDTHWNERGNDVAAAELLRWLSGPAR
jgi:hypothetical protein